MSKICRKFVIVVLLLCLCSCYKQLDGVVRNTTSAELMETSENLLDYLFAKNSSKLIELAHPSLGTQLTHEDFELLYEKIGNGEVINRYVTGRSSTREKSITGESGGWEVSSELSYRIKMSDQILFVSVRFEKVDDLYYFTEVIMNSN